jgi:hypothetical protein
MEARAASCSVLPAKVFLAHSWLARSGSMVPSAFGVIRLAAIAFRTAPSVQPRIRAYPRIETPVKAMELSRDSLADSACFQSPSK